MPGVPGRSGGHNAKTIEQHHQEGTFRATRHAGYRNPNPPTGAPEPPGPLTAGALKEWARMCARLDDSGTLSLVDDQVLYEYCKLWTIARKVDRAAERSPVHDGTKIRPVFDLARRYKLALRDYLVQFGLTPASRGRVRVPEVPATQPDNKFLKYRQPAAS